MKNRNSRLKLFNFLSIIYSPIKYPLKYNLVNEIANNMFSKKYSRLLLQNFSGSDLGYFIDINNQLFDLDNFVYRVNFAIKYLKKDHNLLWALYPSFNRQEVKQEFLNKLNNIMTSDNKNTLMQTALKEINQLKEVKTIISNKRDIEEFKYLLNHDEFEMARRLYDYPPYYLLKGTIRSYLNLWYEENKKNWIDTIKQFNNPIIQISLNYLYNKENYLFYIKQINNDDSKIIKSLFIMNCFNQIIRQGTEETNLNKRIINSVVNKIAEFDDNFFWFGILLSNSEYIFPRTKSWVLEYIEKKTKAKLVELLNDSNVKEAIETYKNGLKQTPRNTSLRHFNIFNKLKDKNKKIALCLMQELINDYREQVGKKNLYLTDNIDINYINSLIDAISTLCIENKLQYEEFFNNLLSLFFLTEEDYKYKFSEMIETKSTVLHIFLTLFGTIDVLNKQRELEFDKIKKYFDIFLKYINLFRYYDHDIYYIDKVFELKIFKDENMIEKEIKHLFEDSACPEFTTISILISKTKKSKYINDIIKFTNDYFDKYHNEWLKNQTSRKYHIFEQWKKIFIRLNDSKRENICEDVLEQK